MKHFLFSFLLFSFLFSSAQNPLVKQWDYRFGGTELDFLTSFKPTPDGGYILIGHSGSGANGDRTQANWDTSTVLASYDCWVVKIDSIGNKQWDKRYGGTRNDELYAIESTKDGGYIVGGWSQSGISGDKTETNWDTTLTGFDYWIIKIDSNGNKQWDKRFGGDGYDFMQSLQLTDDGGYLLGGYSDSPISGDKAEPNRHPNNLTYDYWIVKVDSIGNKVWDKVFGGNENDQLYSLKKTTDGGYILGGWSQSGINGDKTESNWGTGPVLSPDYWIVKITANGNKLWDKRFGGTRFEYFSSLIQTNDNGFLLTGYSNSNIDGNKTQPNRDTTTSTVDCWVVKTDSVGNKQWDKTFGGGVDDEGVTLFQTYDGGYLLGNDSYSQAGGDKTENNFGVEQSWIIKVDSLGIKQWDKTIRTNGHDETGFAIQTVGHSIVIANSSISGIGGFKSESCRGRYDYWIIKFRDTTHCSPFPVIISSTKEGICSDKSVEICAESGFLNYAWNNNETSNCIITNLAGNYYVTVTDDNNCTAESNHVALNIYSVPSVSISVNGDTLSAYNAVTYQWYLNGNEINGANDSIYIIHQSGSYSVAITDTNGCTATSNPIVVSGISKSAIPNSQFEISPNPFTTTLSISLQKENLQQADFTITNIIGQPVYTKHESNLSSSYTKTLDLSYLPSGVYFLEVIAGGERSVRQLVKQ